MYSLPEEHILGMRVNAATGDDIRDLIVREAADGVSAYVCLANVHMTMESYDSDEYRAVVNGAFIVCPDGMPLVWALRLLGLKTKRVCGPDLALEVCEAAASQGIPVALYGGTESSLGQFAGFLQRTYPRINIVCTIAPPFRTLSRQEDDEYTRQLVASGARILLVGLGCPRQERWMAAHRGKIPAVMLGVGAVFDIYAGRVGRAPVFMQEAGLEWLFRFVQEPRRLWKRYLKHNPRFLVLFGWQLVSRRWRRLRRTP